MKLRHNELEIPPKEPFRNCQLNRRRFAEILTSVVEGYREGFVLSINNEWGAGKTTFIRMWRQHLTDQEYHTLYFNAWENDFDSNPLAAIMAELKTLSPEKDDKVFKSVVAKGAKLLKHVAPALLKAAIKQHFGDVGNVLSEFAENTTTAATEMLDEQMKEYSTKKDTLKEFRSQLEKYVQHLDGDKPVVFFIDELDRCRPTYAVEVLEQMKHLFAVPGIVFVLSVDKQHLASAVRGFYGSEHINTDEYLRRFIDLEYALPAPSIKDFCIYLYQYFDLHHFFGSKRRMNEGYHSDKATFLTVAISILASNHATLRQQEKLFALTRLVLTSFDEESHVFPNFLFLLIYLHTLRLESFNRLSAKTMTLQELSDLVAEITPRSFPKTDKPDFAEMEADLIYAYCLYRNNREETELWVSLPDGTKKPSFESKAASKLIPDGFANLLETARSRSILSATSLEQLFLRIELLRPLTMPS